MEPERPPTPPRKKRRISVTLESKSIAPVKPEPIEIETGMIECGPVDPKDDEIVILEVKRGETVVDLTGDES